MALVTLLDGSELDVGTRRRDAVADVDLRSCCGERSDCAISFERHVFMFTDLVGSTHLWEVDEDSMARALRRHDLLVESTIGAHGGSVFKWTGDGCCARFSGDADAVRAALALRIAISSERWGTTSPLSIRIALHAGWVRRYRSVDFVGLSVNETARLLGLCVGGQILASGRVVQSVPSDIDLRPIGRTRLRGITRRIDVHEIAPGPLVSRRLSRL